MKIWSLKNLGEIRQRKITVMKIGLLGPKGTFCYRACRNYIKNSAGMGGIGDAEMVYYPTIDEVFLNSECELGIVPVENTLDGYVQRTLDLLLTQDVYVFDEIILPVQFSMIAKAESTDEIKKLYVQFKANGQCRDFINSLNGVSIVSTQSNMESYYKMCEDEYGTAAIVPAHIVDDSKYEHPDDSKKLIIDNVTDAKHNSTRFVVFTRDKQNVKKYVNQYGKSVRVSVYIMPNTDRPGILYEILKIFHDKNINLISIMSRPTKLELGTYNFYIEIEDSPEKEDIIMQALDMISRDNRIKIVGYCNMKRHHM